MTINVIKNGFQVGNRVVLNGKGELEAMTTKAAKKAQVNMDLIEVGKKMSALSPEDKKSAITYITERKEAVAARMKSIWVRIFKYEQVTESVQRLEKLLKSLDYTTRSAPLSPSPQPSASTIQAVPPPPPAPAVPPPPPSGAPPPPPPPPPPATTVQKTLIHQKYSNLGPALGNEKLEGAATVDDVNNLPSSAWERFTRELFDEVKKHKEILQESKTAVEEVRERLTNLEDETQKISKRLTTYDELTEKSSGKDLVYKVQEKDTTVQVFFSDQREEAPGMKYGGRLSKFMERLNTKIDASIDELKQDASELGKKMVSMRQLPIQKFSSEQALKEIGKKGKKLTKIDNLRNNLSKFQEFIKDTKLADLQEANRELEKLIHKKEAALFFFLRKSELKEDKGVLIKRTPVSPKQASPKNATQPQSPLSVGYQAALQKDPVQFILDHSDSYQLVASR